MSRDKADEVGFNAQKWVWYPHEDDCFAKGYIIDDQDHDDDVVTVQPEQKGQSLRLPIAKLEKVNPPKFDKCDDMASLTFLNEPSVLHNLKLRYQDDLIYTYSGLFLVAINPYKELNIYNRDFIKMYHNKDGKDDSKPVTRPHIFAITEQAFQNLITNQQDQSILVTGESGAGKTENTKKIIQYLTSITSLEKHKDNQAADFNFEAKILEANPILESFGNSQTSRNNNSSRFGKFIKLEFDLDSKKLIGANIEWYLLEKSRVVHHDSKERNYHVFYQLLMGLSDHELSALNLKRSIVSYNYLKGNSTIPGVDDKKEFHHLINALKTVNFELKEIANIIKVLAIILHLGNIEFSNTNSDKQAILAENSPIDDLCKLLEIDNRQAFINSFLKPKVKAGKEYVTQQKSPKQAKFAIDALAKSLYEKSFEYVVKRINQSFDQKGVNKANSRFVGMLDIAGFEIFDKNSFEQLCINYTNEKLQQFFNHHMFVLEQNEYMKENINWQFIDFGNDLIPTIDLIECKKTTQLGIFSILDEECIVPNSTDTSLLEKLNANLESKDKNVDKSTLKYKPNKDRSGFVVKHYAGEVEYDIDGWLNKNRDPLSDAIVDVIYHNSRNLFVKSFYKEEADDLLQQANQKKKIIGGNKSGKKGSMLRTVASRHKTQLFDLMSQLSDTNPHFVRCILPNSNKQQGEFSNELVLSQLRCNGVLEGIRIARAGFPNRIAFAEFFDRYKLLCKNQSIFSNKTSTTSLKHNCELILGDLDLEPDLFKVGSSKLFFKNGVLADLERKREAALEQIMIRFQSVARGRLNRVVFKKKLLQLQASQVIADNFVKFNEMKEDPWFKLFVNLKPLLEAPDTAADKKIYGEKIKKLKAEIEALKKTNGNMASENKKVNVKVNEINDTLTKKRKLLESKETELEQLKRHEIELQKSLSSKVEELKKIQEQLDIMIEENKKLKADLIDSTANLKSGQSAVDKLNVEHDELNSKFKDLSQSLETTKAQHLKSISDSNTLSAEIQMLKSTLKEKESKIKTLEKDIIEKTGSLESQLTSANNNYNLATNKLRDAINEKEELSEQLSRLKSSNNMVDSTIKEKEVKLKVLNESIDSKKSKMDAMESERDVTKSKYEAVKKQLAAANEELRTLSKKHQKLQHDLAQNKTLLESKIEDDVKFARGKHVHDRDILELKETIIDLHEKMSSNYGNNTELEATVRALKYENDQLLKMKKKFDIKIAELTFQLRNRPSTFLIDGEAGTDASLRDEYSSLRLQLNESTANSTRTSLENKHMREELSLLQTRLASESYENRQLKAELRKLAKKTGAASSLSVDENYDSVASIGSDKRSSRESTELRLQLETERRANKRIEGLNIQLQKELLAYKSAQYRPDKRLSGLPDDEDGEENVDYRTRCALAESRVAALETQLRETAFQPLQDATNAIVNGAKTTSTHQRSISQSENLRLSARLNELNAQLKRARSNHDSSASKREEVDGLRSRVEVLESSNIDLSSSVKLYKSRADEYYSRLEAADVAVKAAKRTGESMKRDNEEMKKSLELLQKESKVNDDKMVKLNSQIRSHEQSLSDVRFEKRKLEKQHENLVEKYQAAEDLRASTSTQTSLEHDQEVKALTDEIRIRMDHETDMGKTIKYISMELEDSKRQLTEMERRVSGLSRDKSQLEKERHILIQENDKKSIRQKEIESKLEALVSQVNALKSINEDVILERDQLLETKRSLEAQVTKVTDEFERYLAKNNEDIAHKISVNELEQELSKHREMQTAADEQYAKLQVEQSELQEKFSTLKQDFINTVEENKALTKFNKNLVSKYESAEQRFKETLEEKERSWKERKQALESKISKLNEARIDEDQQVYNLNKLGKDLKFKYEEQLYLTSRYRRENDELDDKIAKMEKEAEELRRQESKNALKVKRTERQLNEYKESCLSLEKELLNWKSIKQ